MPNHEMQTEYTELAQRLDEMGLTGFERDNALAMYARGTLIGNALCKLWESLAG